MIYFDNAATSYQKPDRVKKAAASFIEDRCGNPGRGGHIIAMKAAETVYECRKKLGSFFGVTDPSLVCFTGSCTEALNTAIFGCLGKGDKVITSNIEHNSVRRPLIAAGCDIRTFDALAGEDEILSQVDKLIAGGAKALVCTCASNVFPVSLPVGELGRLCRGRGVLFIADGAQAAGHFDIDVIRDNVDILCIPAHKGLYGIPGCGAMIFSPLFNTERMKPLLYGGSGVNSRESSMPFYPPEKFEAGTLPTVAIAALSAGIDFVNEVCIDEISRREKKISERILNCVSNNDNVVFYHGKPGSLLCFNVKGVPCEKTAAALNEYGVCCRAGLHCSPDAHKTTAPDGAVRISFSVFNTEAEADAFCDILALIS